MCYATSSGLIYLLMLISTFQCASGLESNSVYKVYKIRPTNEKQLNFLIHLWYHASRYDLDFWQPPSKINRDVHVMVSSKTESVFIDLMSQRQFQPSVRIHDVKKLIEQKQWDRIGQLRYRDSVPGAVRFNLGKFHSYAEIGRAMTSVGASGQKPAIWIDAGIHAREWLAPSTALYFIHHMVMNSAEAVQSLEYVCGARTDPLNSKSVAIKAKMALQSMYGTKYQVGTGADTLCKDPASGGSDDWAKSEAGIKYVYLLELRPEDAVLDGFIINERQLLPTAKETWEGIKVVADSILKRNGLQPVTGNNVVVGVDLKKSVDVARNCVDRNPHCPIWASMGGCETWHQLTFSCRKSCGKCSRPPFECKDLRSDCKTWKQMGLCGWVIRSCTQTCDKQCIN